MLFSSGVLVFVIVVVYRRVPWPLWDATENLEVGMELSDHCALFYPQAKDLRSQDNEQIFPAYFFVYTFSVLANCILLKYSSTKIKSVNSFFLVSGFTQSFLWPPPKKKTVTSYRPWCRSHWIHDFPVNTWPKAGKREGTCLPRLLFRCYSYFLSLLYLRKLRADCGPGFRVCFPRNVTRL